MTPAPGHSEAPGTGQQRLEEAETLALRRSQAPARGAGGEEVEEMGVTAQVEEEEPEEEEEAVGGAALKPETQGARGKAAEAEVQTKITVVLGGMAVGQNQEAARALRRQEEPGREAQEEAEAALTASSRPALTPVRERAPGCLAPVLLDAQKDAHKSKNLILP